MRAGRDLDVTSLGLAARLSVRRGGEVLAVDVPASDVLLEWTAERDVPARLTFTAPLAWLPTDAYSPLANFGQRVLLSAVVDANGSVDEIQLGEYVIVSWEETKENVRVEAFDLLHVLAEDPMPFPSSPPANARLSTELARICSGLPVRLDMRDQAVPRDVQYGFDRIESLRDLCAAVGAMYEVGSDGYLHVFARRSIAPVAEFSAQNVLVEAFRSSPARRPNQFTVVGSDESGVHATVRVDFPPFDVAGYGRVTERVENESVTNSAGARAIAENLAAKVGQVTRKRTFQIAPDPRLEGGDVITVTTPGEIVVGKVVAYSLPLSDPSALMRVDVEVLEW